MHFKLVHSEFCGLLLKEQLGRGKPRNPSYNNPLLLHRCLTKWAMKGLHRFRYSALVYNTATNKTETGKNRHFVLLSTENQTHTELLNHKSATKVIHMTKTHNSDLCRIKHYREQCGTQTSASSSSPSQPVSKVKPTINIHSSWDFV